MQVSLGGFFLGAWFTLTCAGIYQSSGPLLYLWVFSLLLSLFHILEFYLTALFRPKELNFNSYCLNHSKAFNYALLAGMFEFLLVTVLL